MKLILPLSSLIHCHIIKSTHMTAYLMCMKPPLKLALGQSQCMISSHYYQDCHVIF
jgi:hypothetical protein